MSEKKGLQGIGVLHEGVPGHRNQSLGVAEELERETGAPFQEFSVPNFHGMERLVKVKSKIAGLPQMTLPEIKTWLEKAGGNPLLLEIEGWMKEKKITPKGLLLISAGSRVAPYNFAISRILGNKAATLMTPKYLGTQPFDFSIIPIHDAMEERANQLVSLGAPNRIQRDGIQEEAKQILAKFPSQRKIRWTILVGGESSTFRIPPRWVTEVLKPILLKAEAKEIDVYVATSRRTRKETEGEIRRIFSDSPSTRLLWFASEREKNPVPGLLSIADRVYCTEDSISMVSEALTAGKAVTLLKTEYVRGPKETFKKVGLKLGLLDSRAIWKPDKFNVLYERFREKGWLHDEGDEPEIKPKIEFHEARRGARWIVENWEKPE